MRASILVEGVVQGVGFRPYVRRAALARGLSGWVKNGRDGVRIELQGPTSAVLELTRALATEVPPPARVTRVSSTELLEQPERGFHILDSDAAAQVAPTLPPDLGICAACSAEVRTPGARRYQYPFTNCTRCGPRYSITAALPYDRAHTSLCEFPLCSACRGEYSDLDDRRYHAQAIACPECGPRLTWLDSEGDAGSRDDKALEQAVRSLLLGEIVAVRGLGGFQLWVDATSGSAVSALRARKRRPHKPFAVLFRSLEQLERYALLSEVQRELLSSPAMPIVLVPRRPEAALASEVAPLTSELGAFLPCTPLHLLLMERLPGPIVCTSGNRADEPICTDIETALERLGAVADGFLSHDRPILRPLDDSVVRASSRGATRVLRRARGYAPLPVARTDSSLSVLALGAYLKSSVAIAHRGALIASQHLGDLGSLEARDLLRTTARELCQFFDARPDVIACDLHPDYPSTRLGQELAEELCVPLLRIQHHHAHVAAVIAEHAVEGAVLGLAWDGTGYGTDATAWGGEALVCRGAAFTRLAHLAPFPLPGGDRAALEPRRAALGALFAFAPDALEAHAEPWFGSSLALRVAALQRGPEAPLSSSMGRLFDAVAALLGFDKTNSFEGQSAMALEQLARRAPPDTGYAVPLVEHGSAAWRVDIGALLGQLLSDLTHSVPAERIARRFHEALIELGLSIAERAGLEHVALSGGCFQNQVLLEGLYDRLEKAGFHVHAPEAVPVNDGGISVGQAWLAGLGE